MIVLPNRLAASRLLDQRLSGPAGGRAVWADDVVTLRGLVDRVLVAHPSPRPRLEGIARNVFLAELVEGLEPEVRRLFGAGIAAAGAARAIGAAIAEVRQAGLTAERLAGAARGRRRIRALAAALDGYERALARVGRWDEVDMAREATALVAAGAWQTTGPREVSVRGLYEVSPVQGELLRALARSARTVRIEVPFDPHNDRPWRFAYPYLKAWETVVDPDLDIDIEYPPHPAAPGLAALLERYQRQGAGSPPSTKGVRLVTAADPADEIRRLAAWVEARARDGVPLEEIGVVLAGGPDYRPALARELRRRGIAWHARRDTPLTRTPELTAILYPLRLLAEGVRRDDLRAWAASPLTTRLDALTAALDLARGPAGTATSGEWDRALAAGGRPLGRLCHSLEELASVERSPAEFWEAYERLCDQAGIGRIGDPARWEAWQAVLGEIEEWLRDQGRWSAPRLGWRAHARLVDEALAGLWTGAGRPGRGVSVLEPFDARGVAFRCSAIAGLFEGTLGRSRAGEAILGDEEREAVNRAFDAGPFAPELFRTSDRDGDEADLLLLERALRTSDELLLSFPLRDHEGASFVPAKAWDDARVALGLPAPAENVDPIDTVPWRVERSAERIVRLQRIERSRTEYFGRKPADRRGAGGPYDGVFPPETAALLLGEFGPDGVFHRWSPSALETWRECPHRFFQQRVLGIKRAEPSPIEAEAKALGTLAHRALWFLYDEGVTGPVDRPRLEAALARAEEEVAAHERGDREVWRIQIKRVARELARYFRADLPNGDFLPERFELGFGLDAALPSDDEQTDLWATSEQVPAVSIDTPRGTVLLRGRIDRLDRDPSTGAIRVVDYKFSLRQPWHREAVNPEICGVDRFQLFAYFLGARVWAAARGYPPSEEMEGWVHCLRQPEVFGPLRSPPPEAIIASIAEAIAQAAGGAYDPAPRDAAICKRCDYNRSCRIATVAGVPPAEEP